MIRNAVRKIVLAAGVAFAQLAFGGTLLDGDYLSELESQAGKLSEEVSQRDTDGIFTDDSSGTVVAGDANVTYNLTLPRYYKDGAIVPSSPKFVSGTTGQFVVFETSLVKTSTQFVCNEQSSEDEESSGEAQLPEGYYASLWELQPAWGAGVGTQTVQAWTNQNSVTVAFEYSWAATYGTMLELSVHIDEMNYSVEYDANGGEWTDEPGIVAAKYSESNTAPPASCAARDDYLLSGWNTKADGSGTAVAPGAEFTGATLGVAENDTEITLYAQWTLKEYALELTPGTGIANVFYRIGDAKEYSTTAASISVPVGAGVKWQAYATPKVGYTYDETSVESPAEGTMEAGGASFAPVAERIQCEIAVSETAEGGSARAVPVGVVDYGTAITLIATPDAGYGFKCWTASTAVAPILANPYRFAAVESVSFTPAFTNLICTVKFDANGGKGTPENRTLNWGEELGAVTSPTKGAYAFEGWYDAKEGGKAYAEDSEITANIKLFAHWSAEPVRCTVDTSATPAAGGTVSWGGTYFAGESVTVTANANEGYDFTGWNNGVKTPSYTFTAGTEDVLLVANFKAQKRTVKLEPTEVGELPGGAWSSKDYAFGDQYGTLPIPEPFDDQYSFVGWTDAEQGGYLVSATNTVCFADATQTLYACWNFTERKREIEKYAIEYDARGGEIGEAYATNYVTGTSVTLPVRVTLEGSDFGGWYTNETGSGERQYKIGSGEAGARKYFAQWTAKNYRVECRAGDYASGDTIVSNYAHNGAVTLPVKGFSRTGYAQSGWAWRSDGTASAVETGTYSNNCSAAFYPSWTPNRYAITLDGNGAAGEMAPVAAQYDEQVLLPANAFVREGYVFQGWATNAEAEVTYADCAIVSNLTAVADGTVTLYAVWSGYGLLSEYAGLKNGTLVNADEENNYLWVTNTDGEGKNVACNCSALKQVPSALRLVVNGPGTIAFKYKKDTYYGDGIKDLFTLVVDGTVTNNLAFSGVIDTKKYTYTGNYTNVSYAVTNHGASTLEWRIKQTDTAMKYIHLTDVTWTPDIQNVTVVVTGAVNRVAYDGEEKSASGWGMAAYYPTGTQAYSQGSISFSGTASVTGTLPGEYAMGLASEQFENTDDQFAVTFRVIDGGLRIASGEIAAAPARFDVTNVYDGTAHSVDPAAIVAAYATAGYEVTRLTYATDLLGTWSEQLPTQTEVGEASFYYRAEATGYAPIVDSASVTVVPYEIGESEVADIADCEETNTEIRPKVTVTCAGRVLAEGSDYFTTYANNLNPGTASVVVTGMGNYAGSVEKSFTITAKAPPVPPQPMPPYVPTANTNVTVRIEGEEVIAAYDGTSHWVSNYVWRASDNRFTADDFESVIETVTNRIDAGISKVGMTADYFRARTAKYAVAFEIVRDCTVEVTPLDFSEAAVAPIPAQRETGEAVEPPVTVKYGEKVLTAETDYTVEYSDNVKPGIASVTVTGVGNYEGAVTANFKIIARSEFEVAVKITGRAVTAVYDGAAHEASGFEWTASSAKYQADDFHCTQTGAVSRVEVGTSRLGLSATDFVNDNDNFVVTFEVLGDTSVTVTRRDLADAKIATIGQQVATGEPIRPTVTVTLAGRTLKDGTDYTTSYRDNVEPGTATVTVTGCGNYCGTASAQFTIVANVRKLIDQVTGEAPVEKTAVTYLGYLYDEQTGAITGTIQVKAAKEKYTRSTGARTSKLTIAIVTGESTKKISISGNYDLDLGGEQYFSKSGREIALTIGENGMTGSFEGDLIQGVIDIFALKDAESKAAAKLADALYDGVYNLVADEGVFSLTVTSKGKAKVKGTTAAGKNTSTISARLLIGEKSVCVPVVSAKYDLAFIVWFDDDEIVVEGLGNALIGEPGTLGSGAKFTLDAAELTRLIGDDTYAEEYPVGVSVEPNDKGKWIVADGVKSGEGNPSALKLTYTAKTGTFKGSFKAYYDKNGRRKAITFTVSGVMVSGTGIGTATARKYGTLDIVITEAP